MKKNATAVTNVNSNKKAVLTMSRNSSCLYEIIVLESIGHNIHLHWAFLRKVKNVICKRFSGNKLVLSWYGHNVSHLIFASCYVRDTHCSRHFHVAIFFLYGEINVKRKFHVIRYVPPQGYGFWAFLVWRRLYTLPIVVWNRVLFSRELRECMNVVFVSIPNEEGNRNTPGALNTRIRNAFEEFFCSRSNLGNDVLVNA